nr:hypothetical protein [Tanacetum cinerariifolium]
VAQNPRVQNVRHQNGLIGVQGNGNQNQIGNGNLVAVHAEGNAAGHNGNQIRCYNCRGLGHFARDCTVRPRRRDAAYPIPGSESRPPMLNKENYVPWSSRPLRYAKSRPNGKLLHNSILNGPYVKRMTPEPGDANRDVNVTETFHEQTDDELSE